MLVVVAVVGVVAVVVMVVVVDVVVVGSAIKECVENIALFFQAVSNYTVMTKIIINSSKLLVYQTCL